MSQAWQRGAVSASESKLGALQDDGIQLQNRVGLDKKRVKSAPGTPYAGRRALSRAKRNKSSQAKRYPRDPKRSWQPPPSARKRVQSEPTSMRPCGPLQFPQVSMVQGSGYVISRTKDAVEMRIDANKFFQNSTKLTSASEQSESQPSRAEYVDAGKMYMITQESLEKEENLQREIVDLNIKLEDLKSSYDEDVNKAKAELSREKQRLHQAHEKELRLLQHSHDNNMIQVEESHKKQMNTLMEKMTSEAEELQEELEHSKKLLEMTKSELEREKEEQMDMLKGTMAAAHKEQMELVGARMLKEQREEFEQTLERVKRSHSQQLLAHEQQHQETIKAILERTGDIKKMEKQFAQIQVDNKALEEQVENLRDEVKQIKQEKTALEAKLLESQTELDDFRNRFEIRVRQVEVKYVDQIDGLRLQNSQLRRKVLDMSVQTSKYQSAVSSLKVQSRPSKSAMFKAVVQARMAANLSLAGDTALSGHASPALEPHQSSKQLRPTSAPVTPKESNQARQAASATDHKKIGQRAQRPQSSSTIGKLVRL